MELSLGIQPRQSNGKFGRKYPVGTTLTDKGYLRYTFGRREYVHRKMMADLLGTPVPANMHVHHADHNKTHNCYCNFQLLDHRIHNAISFSHARFLLNNPQLLADKIQADYEAQMPDWVTEESTAA